MSSVLLYTLLLHHDLLPRYMAIRISRFVIVVMHSVVWPGLDTFFNGGSNIFIYGFAFWTFFNNHPSSGDQTCGNTCQTNGCSVANTKGLYWFNVNIRSVLNMIEQNGVAKQVLLALALQISAQ